MRNLNVSSTHAHTSKVSIYFLIWKLVFWLKIILCWKSEKINGPCNFKILFHPLHNNWVLLNSFKFPLENTQRNKISPLVERTTYHDIFKKPFNNPSISLGHPSASYHANFITQTIGSSADFPPGLLHHHHQPPGTPQQLHHPSQLLHHSPPPPDSGKEHLNSNINIHTKRFKTFLTPGELISRPLEDHEDSSPATAVHLDIRQHPPPPSAAILDPSGLPGFIETYSTRQAFEAAQAAAQAAASASTSSAASQGGSGTSLNNNNSTTSTSGVPQPTTLGNYVNKES